MLQVLEEEKNTKDYKEFERMEMETGIQNEKGGYIMKTCKNCGSAIRDDENICLNCGEEQEVVWREPVIHKEPVKKEETTFRRETIRTQKVVVETNQNTSDNKAPMILGIVSIVLATTTFCCLGIIGTIAGLICGILAIVFARKGKIKGQRLYGVQKAGFITGIIGTVLSSLFGIIFFIVIIASVLSEL